MDMKSKSRFRIPALVTGIIVSLFFLLAFGPKFMGELVEKGTDYFNEILNSYVHWEDPNAFFITYFIGYILVWWRPLWGAVIMMAAGVIYVVIAGFDGPPIFAAPAFVVGILYLLYWLLVSKEERNVPSNS